MLTKHILNSPDRQTHAERAPLIGALFCVVFALFCLLAGMFAVGIRFICTFLFLAGLAFAFFSLLYFPFSNPFLRGAARFLRRLMLVGCALFLLSLIAVETVIITGARINADEDASYIIVLGAGLNGETPSYVLQYRMEAALSYLEAHPNTFAVLSGGQGKGESITEAQAMKRFLTGHGISRERLILEEHSTSTEENIDFSLALIKEDAGRMPAKVGIVSTRFHLYRAILLTKRPGLSAFGISAPLPHLLLFRENYYLREYFAVVRTYVKLLTGL